MDRIGAGHFTHEPGVIHRTDDAFTDAGRLQSSQFDGYENAGWLSPEPPSGIVVPRNVNRIADDPEKMSTDHFILNLGPQHPSTHGVLRVVAEMNGETLMSGEAHIGYLHRGIEKLAEHYRYYQIGSLLDRGDYVSGIHSELALAMATETLAEIEVPERAHWLRTLFSEVTRISSHTIWLGPMGLDSGAMAPFLYLMRDREALLEVLEEVTGSRMMFNYVRPGGVLNDITPNAERKLRAFLDTADEYLEEHWDVLAVSEIFQQRIKGIGVVTREQALAMAATGFVARGSGVDIDVRRDRPYAAYDKVEFDVATRTDGDIWARYELRFDEWRQSLRIMRQILDGIPEGPVMAEMPRVLRVPAGETYAAVESPRGEMGIHLFSDGSDKPTRVRYRPPALYHLQIAEQLLPGQFLGDSIVTLGSFDFVLGEIDR